MVSWIEDVIVEEFDLFTLGRSATITRDSAERSKAYLFDSIVDEMTVFSQDVFLDEFPRREQLVAFFTTEFAFLFNLDVRLT